MGISLAGENAVSEADEEGVESLRIAVTGSDMGPTLAALAQVGFHRADVLLTGTDPSDYDLVFARQGALTLTDERLENVCLMLVGSNASYKPLTIDEHRLAQQLPAVLGLASQMQEKLHRKQQTIQRLGAALADTRETHASIDGDLVEAKKLQQSLLRDRGISHGKAELALFLQSSGHVGGDLVGHFPIDDRHLGFFAIDVSGHGITSALMAARLAGYLSTGSAQANIALADGPKGPVPRDPAEVVAEFNALVLEELETEHYFTLLLGHMDTQTGRVAASQAGHPHPILIRADGSQHDLGSGGLPVGLIPGADYETFQVNMMSGDRLIILSDGFIEAELPDGRLLGEDGLAKLLTETRSLPVHRTLDTLVWRLSQICGDAGFADDLSGVVISFSDD